MVKRQRGEMTDLGVALAGVVARVQSLNVPTAAPHWSGGGLAVCAKGARTIGFDSGGSVREIESRYPDSLSWLISEICSLTASVIKNTEATAERLLRRAEQWEAKGEGGLRDLLASVIDEASEILREDAADGYRAFVLALGELTRASWGRPTAMEKTLMAALREALAAQ